MYFLIMYYKSTYYTILHLKARFKIQRFVQLTNKSTKIPIQNLNIVDKDHKSDIFVSHGQYISTNLWFSS